MQALRYSTYALEVACTYIQFNKNNVVQFVAVLTNITAETSTLSIKLHMVPVFNFSACVIKQIARIHLLKISCYSSQLFLSKYTCFSSATNMFITSFHRQLWISTYFHAHKQPIVGCNCTFRVDVLDSARDTVKHCSWRLLPYLKHSWRQCYVSVPCLWWGGVVKQKLSHTLRAYFWNPPSGNPGSAPAYPLKYAVLCHHNGHRDFSLA